MMIALKVLGHHPFPSPTATAQLDAIRSDPQQFSSKSLWVFLFDFVVLLAISYRSLTQLQASCLNPCMPLLLVVQRGAANVPWLCLLSLSSRSQMQRAAAWMDRETTRVVQIRHPFKAVVPSSTVVFETLGGIRTCDRPFTIIQFDFGEFFFLKKLCRKLNEIFNLFWDKWGLEKTLKKTHQISTHCSSR